MILFLFISRYVFDLDTHQQRNSVRGAVEERTENDKDVRAVGSLDTKRSFSFLFFCIFFIKYYSNRKTDD